MLKTYWRLGLVLAAYFALGASFAIHTPPWQNPDEPAHWNYTRQLWQTGRLPSIDPEDWDPALVPIGPDRREIPLLRYTYEDHQPPLFYALAAPVFGVFDGDLTALRLFALCVGAVGIVACYSIAQTVGAGMGVAAFAAGLMALLPQHLAMMASFNNDALSESLLACVVLLCSRMLMTPPARRVVSPPLILLGILTGLCMFTKAQAYLALPLAVLSVLWMQRAQARRAALSALLLLLLAVVIPSQWWARNAALYGPTDWLGLQRHNAVVVGQPTTVQWIGLYGMQGWLGGLLQTTFQSFWGQFGWMSVLPRREFYVLALGDTLLSAALFMDWWRAGRNTLARARAPLTLLALLFGLTLGAFGWYNAQFYQAQGRYLFPALVPMSLAASLGWHWMLQRWQLLHRSLWLFLLMGFGAMDAWLLLRVILPAMK